MTDVIIISAATLCALTASILFFPSVKIKGHSLDTYPIAVLVGALILIVSGLAPADDVVSGLTASTDINPLKILILFFSMTVLSVYLDEAGLFRKLAGRAVHHAGKSQLTLFVILYLLTSVLTVFTSNDIVILTLTPFICFFCKNAGISPLPYLVGEFAAANTWSMMLIIGNPTNIYLCTSAHIVFTEYFRVMALPTLAAGVVEFLLIMLVFGKKLRAPVTPREDDFRIPDRISLINGIIHLSVCLLLLVISGYVNIPMWLCSLLCAVSLTVTSTVIQIIRGKRNSLLTESAKRLPWQLIPFVLSMFVIVIALNCHSVSQAIGNALGSRDCTLTYGTVSFLASNMINNIPMSMLFSGIPVNLPADSYLRAIYATVTGSNIGAFLTPIGALAGIMFTGLTQKHGVKYGFAEFVKYGLIISIPTISTALLVLSFMSV